MVYIPGASCFGPTMKVRIDTSIDKNKIIRGDSTNIFENGLEGKLDKEEKDNLIRSSISILSNCVAPNFSKSTKKNNTGLVLGKIQSGKTLSFTSLTALARDNGYRLIIIISGRTNLLLQQTVDRLREDLVKKDKKRFNIILNADNKKYKKIFKKLDSKKEKLVIMPVLKHQDRISDLKDLFSEPRINNLITKKSVLIIDDEADQASLNTQARNNERFGLNNESAIYASVKNLRYNLPNHSYIQYTATPQGPLLIDSLSLLSPDWHVVLTPGKKYTGGNAFFDGNYQIVENIKSEGNYPPDLNDLESPPNSLRLAIIEFLILSALMDSFKDKKKCHEQASMLIHPTHLVNEKEATKDELTFIRKGIKNFYDWTVNILETAENELIREENDEFLSEYNKIKKRLENKNIFKNFPLFEDVIDIIKEEILDDYEVYQVTGGMLEKGEEFPWDHSSYNILVGGQLLDRGFTVENLIMTYMPRDTKGKNQSDTIQQRCRFYGYRKDYLPFCRVYLTNGLIYDYHSYNEFENEIHDYLSKHSLEDFYKNGSAMLMGNTMNPTNISRISEKIISHHLTKTQYFEAQFPFISENNTLITNFINKIKKEYTQEILMPKIKTHQKENVRHRVTKILPEQIIELLLKYQINNKHETLKKRNILRYIHDLVSNSNKECWVIEIAYEKTDPRERTIKKVISPKNARNQYELSALFAGDTDFRTDKKSEIKTKNNIYFGDRDLLVNTNELSSKTFNYKEELIIQIHKIKAGQKTKSDVEFQNEIFYTLGFYFPEQWAKTYISKISKQ